MDHLLTLMMTIVPLSCTFTLVHPLPNKVSTSTQRQEVPQQKVRHRKETHWGSREGLSDLVTSEQLCRQLCGLQTLEGMKRPEE